MDGGYDGGAWLRWMVGDGFWLIVMGGSRWVAAGGWMMVGDC